MKKNKTKAKLTQGPLIPILIDLTLPMMWGVMAFISFNIIDTYFVGQLGTDALAAISFTFPVIMVLFNFTIGLGIGLSSTVARAIGEGDEHVVRHLTTSGLILTALFAAVITLGGIWLIDPVFTMLGASPHLIDIIRPYMQIILIGMFFIMMPIVGNAAIRATGDSRSPGIIMVGSAILNAILDPIFIFGWFFIPSMGIEGAAIASLISRVLTCLASLGILFFRERMITMHLDSWRMVWVSWKKILHVGIPAAATNMIIPLGMGVIMSMLAQYGKETVAAFGVAMRIESFAFIIMYAMSSIIGPVVGQNWGANLKHRVRESVNLCSGFCMVWGAVMAVLLYFVGAPLTKLFNDDFLVIEMARQYFWIVSIGYGAHGVVMMLTAVFNALGKAFFSAFVSFVRFFVLYIPLAYLGDRWWGVQGIFAAFPISSILAAGGVYCWNRYYCKE